MPNLATRHVKSERGAECVVLSDKSVDLMDTSSDASKMESSDVRWRIEMAAGNTMMDRSEFEAETPGVGGERS